MLHDTQISATFKLDEFSEKNKMKKKCLEWKYKHRHWIFFLPNHFTFNSKQPLCVIHVAETYTFFPRRINDELSTDYVN